MYRAKEITYPSWNKEYIVEKKWFWTWEVVSSHNNKKWALEYRDRCNQREADERNKKEVIL